ncbi:MAG: hypothetical protein LUE27_06880 [Clostridia bacterium]|nr:hypothetical protein [Clostridia bacterium]
METVVVRVDYTHSHMNRKGNVREVKSCAYLVVSHEEAAGMLSEFGYRWITELLQKKDVFNPCIIQLTVMTAKDMDMKVLKEM